MTPSIMITIITTLNNNMIYTKIMIKFIMKKLKLPVIKSNRGKIWKINIWIEIDIIMWMFRGGMVLLVWEDKPKLIPIWVWEEISENIVISAIFQPIITIYLTKV